MTKDILAKEIQSAVKWLIEEDCGCSTIKLDNRLAVCVGWSDGYDPNDAWGIHSKESPTFCITAGIKVWTSDDLRTDFDWINSPYYEGGEVWDDDQSISLNEDYEALAEFYLKEYETLSGMTIAKDGRILREHLWVCEHCLCGIESHEGRQAIFKHDVDETDEDESRCDWCEETGFCELYELI